MIVFLIPTIAIIIAILFCISKKTYSLVKKICFIILILNISFMSFFSIIFFGTYNILFLINFLINIIFIILLTNLKFELSNKTAVILLIIYFIIMIILPVYKVEDHEHIFVNENSYNNSDNKNINNILSNNVIDNMIVEAEKHLDGRTEMIIEYIDYYNIYGIKLKRIYKDN